MYMYSKCLIAHQCESISDLFVNVAMGIDIVILMMTISGLWFIVQDSSSGLWKMLFTDGIVYFTLVFSANSVPAVRLLRFDILDLISRPRT